MPDLDLYSYLRHLLAEDAPQVQELHELRERLERAEAALREIEVYAPIHGLHKSAIREMKSIARAALGEGEG